MKHVATNLNYPNEPIMFNHSTLGNYSYNSFFGNHIAEISPCVESSTQSEILHCTHIFETHCNIVDRNDNNNDVQSNIVSRYKLQVIVNLANPTNSEK
jgi:hypothetical protein